MRKASIVLAITACAASSLSFAQQRDPPPDMASPAAVATTSAGPDGTGRGKSGFGQIMSVLTGLLQDAAGKESASASSSATRILSSDQSAVTITVTPVAGRSTFFVDRSSVHKPGRGRPDPGNTAPPAQAAVTVTTIDAQAVAVEGGVPD